MPNLKELTISDFAIRGAFLGPRSAGYSLIFEGCSFSLRRLSVHGFVFYDINDLVERQPDLEDLCYPHRMLPDDAFPELKIFETSTCDFPHLVQGPERKVRALRWSGRLPPNSPGWNSPATNVTSLWLDSVLLRSLNRISTASPSLRFLRLDHPVVGIKVGLGPELLLRSLYANAMLGVGSSIVGSVFHLPIYSENRLWR